jgi:hypothetical protein
MIETQAATICEAEWNDDTNGSENLCHKSIQQTKSIKRMANK